LREYCDSVHIRNEAKVNEEDLFGRAEEADEMKQEANSEDR